MLHLLREASIESATANLLNPEAIFERNIKTRQGLGMDHRVAELRHLTTSGRLEVYDGCQEFLTKPDQEPGKAIF